MNAFSKSHAVLRGRKSRNLGKWREVEAFSWKVVILGDIKAVREVCSQILSYRGGIGKAVIEKV
jgi:hypothetical protein